MAPVDSDNFTLSSELTDEYLRLSPIRATFAGVPEHDHRWDDFSPEGVQEVAALLDRYRDRFLALPAVEDRWGSLALRVAGDFVDERLEIIAHGEPFYDLNSIASPVQHIRQVFDLMPTSTATDWENIVVRLASLDEVLAGYRRALQTGVGRGTTASVRQVAAVVEESRLSDRSWMRRLADALENSGSATSTLSARLDEASDHAARAFAAFADFLEREYGPAATTEDGVGRERYERNVRRFLGTELDLRETYRWGWEQVAELRDRMMKVARRIDPAGHLREVVDLVKTDPECRASSPEEFVEMMSERQASALRELEGAYFDIPPQAARLDVRIAPPGGSLGAYYVPASEDFRRPGTVWYSIGSQSSFPLWDEVSTAYHEGFPGHHLQSGTQLSLADRLSRLHRLLVWYPGYGEGWALYAETLMDELGYLERPEYELGMLSSSMLRACRVVIDIGSHLGYPIPGDSVFHPGGRWTFALATEMLEELAFLDSDYAISEVTRYLGWPGQAISYKVGEWVILGLRDQLRRRKGEAFDLREFHSRVLGAGPVGLDHLRDLVLGG